MPKPIHFSTVFAYNRLSTCDGFCVFDAAVALFRRLQDGIIQTSFASYGAGEELRSAI